MQTQLKTNNRIKRLDNRLANQIAAGEVVDRPSSVLKELMENAIDAGAKKVEVEVERGGIRLIKVTDNGTGIQKDDLTLALTRHATSKIKNVTDLSAIYSLGFRGEALASISSVSRLTLTSRTHEQSLAWQAITEGRDMDVKIQPASAVAGTRVEVRDLFFNTPARQKFLRTERTEFLQIEDTFKRIALSNFDVSFTLKHNGKIVKKIPAVTIEENRSVDGVPFIISSQERHRLAHICGKAFSNSAIIFECEHEAVTIKGFVGGYEFHRSESDLQFIFINDRAVKDKTLTHAVRLAYQDKIPAGRMASYVIYLYLDAEKVDVNVHPTKNEVRFENQRDIHDLLFKTVNEALSKVQDVISLSIKEKNRNVAFSSERSPKQKKYSKETLYSHTRNTLPSQHFISEQADTQYWPTNQVTTNPDMTVSENIVNTSPFYTVTRLDKGFSLISSVTDSWFIDEISWVRQCLLNSFKQNKKLESIDLLFPELVSVENAILEEYDVRDYFCSMGFQFEPHSKVSVKLKGVPFWCKYQDKNKVINLFTHWQSALNGKRKNNYEIVLSDISECFEIDSHAINYFLEKNIFTFESESNQFNNSMIKITSDIAESCFNNKKEQNRIHTNS